MAESALTGGEPTGDRTGGALGARVARLEAVEEIRQLAVRYALGIDSRDIDSVVALFVDDGRPVFHRGGDGGTPGGAALRASYLVSQSRYVNSQHFMCNHVIEVLDPDHAKGVVYALVHQEIGERWTVAAMQYWDVYERVRDRWRFAERRTMPWYMTDWESKPVGPLKMRGSDGRPTEAPLPTAWASWGAFWREVGG